MTKRKLSRILGKYVSVVELITVQRTRLDKNIAI